MCRKERNAPFPCGKRSAEHGGSLRAGPQQDELGVSQLPSCHEEPATWGRWEASRKESVLWRKRFKLLSLVSFKNRVKNQPENARKFAGKTWKRDAKILFANVVSKAPCEIIPFTCNLMKRLKTTNLYRPHFNRKL